MSPLPASAVINSGQVLEAQGGTVLQRAPGLFSRMQADAGSQPQPVARQLATERVSPAPNSLPSASLASANVLKPKLESAGSSLSDLNARAATIKPANVAESLQNRLDLLNVQFRVLGDHLQESAAKNDPMQLLRLQNDIYQLDEELELVSKVVDQTTNGVRSLLQTQL
ncbi:MAG TPA: hypothetical protein VH351_15075 [Bryobacteraceae bacterium]|jgi:hypothetical protein|nr:hypothetical protein [Bryobacteraceae bacterium]